MTRAQRRAIERARTPVPKPVEVSKPPPSSSPIPLKEKVEGHPVVVYCGIAVAALVGGWYSHVEVQNASNVEAVPKGSWVAKADFDKVEEQLRAATTQAAAPTKTGIKLQFFGDNRAPTAVTFDNVAEWFTWVNPDLVQVEQDKRGVVVRAHEVTPPSWIIFLALDKPVAYGEVIVESSNPQALPFVDRQRSTSRVIVVSVRGQVPPGILDIHVK